MKTEIGKCITLISMFTLLTACASTDSLTSAQNIETLSTIQDSGNNIDHNALAEHHEKLAEEFQAKVKAQEEVLEHKPRSSYFGKHGRNVKSHVAFKIREYNKAIQESLEKASYHRKIAAEQLNRESAAQMQQENEQKNKI